MWISSIFKTERDYFPFFSFCATVYQISLLNIAYHCYMPITKKPTTKQKNTFNNILAATKEGKVIDMKTAMIKGGYTEATAKNPEKNLTSRPQWQELLAKIDNEEILNTFYEIMIDKQDKDARIKSAKELATLKDLYPATKSKIIGLFDKISELEE